MSCLKPCSDHYIYIAKKCNCLSMFFCVIIFKMVCEQGANADNIFLKRKKWITLHFSCFCFVLFFYILGCTNVLLNKVVSNILCWVYYPEILLCIFMLIHFKALFVYRYRVEAVESRTLLLSGQKRAAFPLGWEECGSIGIKFHHAEMILFYLDVFFNLTLL